MNLHKLSDTSKVIPLFLADATNTLSGKTGLTVAVTLSKNTAGSFAAATGTVAEVGSGVYNFTPSSGDVGTLGPLVVLATATGAVNFLADYRVVAFDPYSATNLGLSAVPTASPNATGGLPVLASGTALGYTCTGVAGNVTGTVANVLEINGVAPTFSGTNINANSAQVGGQTASAAGAVTFPGSIASSTQIPANFTNATFASAGVFATAALANTPGAADPWATVLPGSYTTGEAGYIVGTNLNATVASRSTFASGGNVNVATILTVTPLMTGQYLQVDVWDVKGSTFTPISNGNPVPANTIQIDGQPAASGLSISGVVGTVTSASQFAIVWNTAYDGNATTLIAGSLILSFGSGLNHMAKGQFTTGTTVVDSTHVTGVFLVAFPNTPSPGDVINLISN